MHIKTITSKLLGLCLLTIAFLAQPLLAVEILDAASGVQASTASTGTATGLFSDVTSTAINLGHSGKVLVMSAYSMDYDSGNKRSGSWQLSDGTSNSLAISRYIGGPGDRGIGMAVGLFDYASASGTVSYTLQHATNSGLAINTDHASIVAIPMVSQNGLTLNSSQATQVDEVGTDLTSFSPVATGNINLTNGGHVFLSAAFSTHTYTASKNDDRVGEWQLQLETSTGVWANVGNTSQRFMTSTSDTGAAMLMGTYDTTDLDINTTYAYRLMQRSTVEGAGVSTSAVTVTAMGFSFSEDIELPHWQASDTIATTTSTAAAIEKEISVVEPGNLFLGASFSANMVGTGSITADYNLAVDGTPISESATLQRTIADADDFASGGAVALTSSLDPGDYFASLQHATSGQTLQTLNPNLVIFSTASVPEPATMGLLAIGGIAMLLRRNR